MRFLGIDDVNGNITLFKVKRFVGDIGGYDIRLSGDKVLIDGSYIDNGWWKTNYLLVYPELRILF